MPRASSSAKRQQGAAHQRDTRHENGLVGPGKRISKQKSHNQLAEGGHRPGNGPDDAVCSTQPAPLPAAAANGAAKDIHGSMAVAEHRTPEALRRASLGTNFDSSSTESLGIPPALHEETHRRIDVNNAKNANVHRDTGPIDLALTVLRSCPLYDTIAILIILMQLSPFALSSIYMLFTILTFVPPVTTSSGLSLTDIFEGTLGTPSVTTLLCMDIVVFLVWVFLWGPLQYLILDFAQVVIALTLGGGAGSRQGSTNNMFVCVGIVLLSHFGRYPGLQRLSHLSSALGVDRFISSDPDDPLEPAAPQFGRKGAYSWIRNALAMHIFTQGVVRYIREWYLRREKRDMQSQSLSDAEAGKPPFSTETSTDGGFSTPDVDATQPANALNVSNKKKRKQSAQVRTRQPLWAALASTKIVMVKEYELSHAARESAGSEATDVDNLGNAPFHSQPRQIWICYVGHDEVCFNTSHFPELEEPHENGHATGAAYIDMNKPFYVKVNNAIWQPTRITPVNQGEGDDIGSEPGTRWTGDIYGLAPLSTYEVEFICTHTGESLFFTSVRTAQAPSQDAEPTAKTSNQRRRHESPATTIKGSIATQETKLNDERTKLKALRKEHHRKVNVLRKEIEKLSSSAQSAGGSDEKLRQKIAQNMFQQKQAEQSVSELEEELKDLATVPEDVRKEHRNKQNAWNAEKATFDGARATFKSFKNSIDGEVKELEEEQATLQAKRNKIAARIVKADADHARITDANARGLDEAERRRQERVFMQAQAAQHEMNYKARLADMRSSNEEKAHRVDGMKVSMRAYLSHFDTEMPPYDDHGPNPNAHPFGSGGPPPWATAPGPQYQPNAMWPTPVAPTSVPPSGHSVMAHPPMFPLHLAQPAIGSSMPSKTRGRSSSMLSDVSGFTQSSAADDDLAPVHTMQPIGHGRGPPPGFQFPSRKRGSSGSGSGSAFGSASGSGSSVASGAGTGSAGASVRDPTSPV